MMQILHLTPINGFSVVTVINRQEAVAKRTIVVNEAES
jgi:hypothetical protein